MEGFEGSSEVLKKYKERKVYPIFKEIIGEVERMLKALIKSLEHKHLNP
jgi:hypothetical protein